MLGVWGDFLGVLGGFSEDFWAFFESLGVSGFCGCLMDMMRGL